MLFGRAGTTKTFPGFTSGKSRTVSSEIGGHTISPVGIGTSGFGTTKSGVVEGCSGGKRAQVGVCHGEYVCADDAVKFKMSIQANVWL